MKKNLMYLLVLVGLVSLQAVNLLNAKTLKKTSLINKEGGSDCGSDSDVDDDEDDNNED